MRREYKANGYNGDTEMTGPCMSVDIVQLEEPAFLLKNTLGGIKGICTRNSDCNPNEQLKHYNTSCILPSSYADAWTIK